MLKNNRFRQFLLVVIFLSSILVIATPWLVSNGLWGLKEETWETLIIVFFITLIYAAQFLYFKEFRRLKAYQGNLEERLQETFKYVGSMNLQLDEIKNAFSNFKKYPQSKKEMKEVFDYFANKILSLVNASWVVLKIINVDSGRTLREIKVTRGYQEVTPPKIENHDILAGRCYLQECTIIQSEQENLSIKACCIMPIKVSNKEQEFFIQSIINQLEMMFLVFSSLYYKQGKNKDKH